MAQLAPPAPPLLLTKRVTSFLHANLSAHIHTAALTTPSGRLLAHASLSSSARALRRQCAVAASLWAIHGPSSRLADAAEAALPKTCSSTPGGAGAVARAVTVQLAGGAVFVVRALRCGILFVAVGGGGGGTSTPGSDRPVGSSPRGEGSGVLPHLGVRELPLGHQGNVGPAVVTVGPPSSPPLGSPSEAESVLSAGTGAGASVVSHATSSAGGGGSAGGGSTATVLATRRQAEELARWLDEKLGTLSVPEEIIGPGWDTR